MLSARWIALSLLFAISVAGASTWVRATRVVAPLKAGINSRADRAPPIELAKARVVYAGYVSDAMLENIRQTAGPKEVTLAISDPPAPARAATASPNPATLDLNLASVEELNLAGGGMIGKAIVKGRPYASVDDLLAKRVVNRATFATIKGRVAVRT